MRAWWVFLGVAVVGCQRHSAPAPGPARPAVVVPEGCEANLSGEWVHAADPTFRYRADDDGGTLHLTVARVEAPDASFHPRRFRDAGVDASVVATRRGDAGTAHHSADAGTVADGGADAGASPALASSAGSAPGVHLLLTRTAQGFVGETRVVVQHPSGRECLAVFSAEVVDCRDGGLVLHATPAVALGDACQAPDGEAAAPVRQTLQRAAAP